MFRIIMPHQNNKFLYYKLEKQKNHKTLEPTKPKPCQEFPHPRPTPIFFSELQLRDNTKHE